MPQMAAFVISILILPLIASGEIVESTILRGNGTNFLKVVHINPEVEINGRSIPMTHKEPSIPTWWNSQGRTFCRENLPEGYDTKTELGEIEGYRILTESEMPDTDQSNYYRQQLPYRASPNRDGSFNYYGLVARNMGDGWHKLKMQYAAAKITCTYELRD